MAEGARVLVGDCALDGILVRAPYEVGLAVEVAAFAGLDVRGKAVLVATGWDGFQGIADGFRNQPGWTVREVKCGHDVPIDRPEELSGLLEEAAR